MTTDWANQASGFCSATNVVHSVYGQLEPPNISSKPGWRYLQCTENLNECKVLLPPHISRLYEQLLNAEVVARRDAPRAEYEEILHIKRHVIKKCLKLRGKPVTFKNLIEIHAPEDFSSRKLQAWANRTLLFTATNAVDGNGSIEALGAASASGRLMRSLSWTVRALRPSEPTSNGVSQTKSIRHKRSQSSQRGRKNNISEGERSDCPDGKPAKRTPSKLRKRSRSRPNNQPKQSDSERATKPHQGPSVNIPPAQASSKQSKAKEATSKREKQQPKYVSRPSTFNTEFYMLADGLRSSTISQVIPVDIALVPTYPTSSNPRFPTTRLANTNNSGLQPGQLPGMVGSASSFASSSSRQASANRAPAGRLEKRANTVPRSGAHSSNPLIAPKQQQSQPRDPGRSQRNDPQTVRSGEGQVSRRTSQQPPYYPYYPNGDAIPRDPIQRPPSSAGGRRATFPEPHRQPPPRASVGPPSSTPLPPRFHEWIEQQAAASASLVQGNGYFPNASSPVQLSPPTSFFPGQPTQLSPSSPTFPQPIYSSGMLHRSFDDSDFSRSPSPESPFRGAPLDTITPEASQYSRPQSRSSKVSDPVIPDLAYLEIADLHQKQQSRDISESRLTYYPDSSGENLVPSVVNDTQPIATASSSIRRTPSRGILVTGSSRPASRNSVRSNRSVTFAFSPHQDARNHVRDCEADRRTAFEQLQVQEIWRKSKPGDRDVEQRYQSALAALKQADERLRAAEADYTRRYPKNAPPNDEEPYFETTYV